MLKSNRRHRYGPADWATLRASVGHTSARIALPPICFGHIDRGAQGDFKLNPSSVDGFSAGMSIYDITTLLSSAGFSPPSWLKPFPNGEQFRVRVHFLESVSKAREANRLAKLTLLVPGEKGYHVRERSRSARATGFS
jgi:hypothetical protein